MTNSTLNLIASQVVGSGGASSVTFSSIPQTYTDLKILLSARDTKSSLAENLNYQFNGSTSGFSGKYLAGTGTSVITGNWTNPTSGAYNSGTSTSSTFSDYEMYIPNYTSSNYKSVSVDSGTESAGSNGYDWFDAMLWSNTAAITSITFTAQTAFAQYSTFYLYGIKNS